MINRDVMKAIIEEMMYKEDEVLWKQVKVIVIRERQFIAKEWYIEQNRTVPSIDEILNGAEYVVKTEINLRRAGALNTYWYQDGTTGETKFHE